MAEYEINVASQYRKYLSTNKGPLWFTVLETDTEFVGMNDRYVLHGGNYYRSLDGSIANHRWYENDEWNVVNTPFQTVDGRVRGEVVNSQLQVYFDNNNIYHSIESTTYYHTLAIGTLLIHFSNGYSLCANGRLFHDIMIFSRNWPEPDNYRIYLNGPNSFGNFLCKNTDGNWTTLSGFTAADLELGEYMYGTGRLYADPYEDGGYTDPEGDVDLPEPDEVPNVTPDDLPSQFSDLSAGLYRLYAMDDSELTAFSQQLWKPSVLSSLKNYLERPTDIVMGLLSYPFEVNAGAGVNIGFNWVNDWVSSGVVGHPISGTGIQQVIFGTLQVPRPSDLFYDYQPFSSAMLHLPYIGFVPMKMNEIVGKTLYIRYSVDLASGDFTAWVTMGASDETESWYNLKVYGYYQGNISKPLPLTQQDMWQLYKKGAEIALNGAAAIGTLATGSLMKATGEYLADMPLTGKGAVLRYESGSEMASAGSAMMGDYKRKGTQAVNSALEMSYVSSPIERNGYLDGSTGRTSSQECFLIITYPDQCVPENQSILGYPTNIPGPLSKVGGYTEVKEIRLASGIASDYELAELEGIVKGGIII